MKSTSAEVCLTLDTNVLVYAVDVTGDLRRHEIAKDLLVKAARAEGLLTLQALAEFYAVATRKKGVSLDEARGFVRDWMEVFPIVRAGPKTLLEATDAVATHRLAFWDALLWATAREAGAAGC